MTLPAFAYSALLRHIQLKGTQVELLPDKEMYDFTLRGLCGGISSCLNSRLAFSTQEAAKMHAENMKNFNKTLDNPPPEINNKEIPETDFINMMKKSKTENIPFINLMKENEVLNDSQLKALDAGPTSIHYLDANNLYGSVQTMSLPQKDFCWITTQEKSSLNKIFNHTKSHDCSKQKRTTEDKCRLDQLYK